MRWGAQGTLASIEQRLEPGSTGNIALACRFRRIVPVRLSGWMANHTLQENKTMKTFRSAMTLAALGSAAAVFSPAATAQSKPVDTTPSKHLEIIHHPDYDKTVFMPFVPAIKIKSGKILWLAGGTALPVYHDHPHKREQILKHLPNDLEAQTRQTMDGIMETLKAAGASPKDVVHVFIFRARPRMGDIGKASAVVNSYFAPHHHKPATTNMAVLELGEPEQLIEIQVVAVVD